MTGLFLIVCAGLRAERKPKRNLEHLSCGLGGRNERASSVQQKGFWPWHIVVNCGVGSYATGYLAHQGARCRPAP